MGEEKVKVNVKVLINEYDKFTFTETLAGPEEVSEEAKLAVLYAFPTNTSPDCYTP